MKEGYVTVKWTKFSVSGAPGTGKSSFLNLLYNEDPPDCHTSNPVITAKEARIISATVGDDSVWKKIDHETLNPFRATDAFMRRWLIVHQRRRRIYAFRVYNISYVDRFTQKLQYFIEHDIFDYNLFQ